MSLKATVRNGRFVIDEPTDLPEGTMLELVVDDESGDMSVEEVAALNASIAISLAEARAGQLIPAEELLQTLRDRRRAR